MLRLDTRGFTTAAGKHRVGDQVPCDDPPPTTDIVTVQRVSRFTKTCYDNVGEFFGGVMVYIRSLGVGSGQCAAKTHVAVVTSWSSITSEAGEMPLTPNA